MSHSATGSFAGGDAQCFVCERTVSGRQWFARVKHGDCTVVLCTEKCAKAFYRQRLPGLRRFQLLAAMSSPQWPHGAETLFNER